MEHIKNIKYSIKIKDLNWEKTINNINVKKIFTNYIVFHDKFVFILFKPNLKKTFTHLNVTKVLNYSQIVESYYKLRKIIVGNVLKETLCIDNCTLTYKTKLHASLQEIYETSRDNNDFNLCYNSDKFPGIFCKHKSGTAIIFHSGSMVLVGIKKLTEINGLLEKINLLLNIS